MFSPKPRERQLTFGSYGHTLNHRQAISPDGEWAVYDTRNDDTHISRTNAIEMVHLESGEIVRLYQTANQSEFGPGVGAASFHPNKPLVAFIHGLENCTREKPYSAARRFGAIVDVNLPGQFFHAEARTVPSEGGVWTRPFGALSGGTHAHSWSSDGLLSFTYNDLWLEYRSRQDIPFRNPRTVGFMVPSRKVPGTFFSPGFFSPFFSPFFSSSPPFWLGDSGRVGSAHPTDCSYRANGMDAGCFSGSFGAFLAASLCENARVGSDEIEAAVEECWVGEKSNALAFLGAVRGESGELENEIFVCELPNANDWTVIAAKAVSKTAMEASDLLKPVEGCVQRRLSRTSHRKFPGIQGPRCWLVSSSDGRFVFAPMRDERGVAQLCRIAVTDGQIEQITELEHPLAGQISLNPSGTLCSFICDQRICLVDVSSGRTQWLTERSDHLLAGAIHFAGENRFVFNRFVGAERERWLQVFVEEMG